MVCRLAPLLFLIASLAAGPVAAQPIKVVASFTILADMTRAVGGADVDVSSLVGPDSDVHSYDPTPDDARRLAAADLVVVNGNGFEGWIDRLVKASGSKAPVVQASAGVRLRQDGHAGHSHGATDPHAWTSVPNARLYAAAIGQAIARQRPAAGDRIKATTAAYLARLDRLDADIRAALAAIPRERRKVVTSHDAFGYFAREYGVTFLAPKGLSTRAEPSAADMAALIRQIRAEKVQALFLENISDRRVLDRIAAESGARIGGRLYSDALSPPGGPADSYETLMRHNLAQLVDALSR
jgi:zinc/manganese transport system substrate-binding protein